MMKGQFSFFLKSLMLLAAVISLIVVAILSHNFTRSVEKQREEAEIIQSADDVINQLISKKCLGYEFQGSGIQPVLDKDKLDEFQSRYIDVEPDCARSFDFDYSVEVRTIPYNFSLYPKGGSAILSLVIDRSGSMDEDVYGRPFPEKWDFTKEAAILFLKKLNETRKFYKVAVIFFGYGIELKGPTYNYSVLIKYINQQKADGGTPTGDALHKALSINSTFIILLSDGCANEGRKPIPQACIAAEKNVTIYTIGYTRGVTGCGLGGNYANPWDCNGSQPPSDVDGKDVLEQIANITGGKFIYTEDPSNITEVFVDIAEEIPPAPEKGIEEVNISEEEWSFGESAFSFRSERSFDNTLSIPVVVKMNISHFVPAILSIHVVKGNLEILKNAIERVCELGKATNQTSYSFKFQTSYPIVMNNGYLCLKSRPEICKRISCDYPVEFENIDKPGLYFIRIKLENNKVRVNT